MAVAADLHAQSGGRTGSEVGRHDRRGTAEESEWIGLHPRIADRKQFRDPGLALSDQNFDRIGTIWRDLPFGLRAERHPPAPFGTLRASLVALGSMPMIRWSVHDSPRIKPIFPRSPGAVKPSLAFGPLRSAV